MMHFIKYVKLVSKIIALLSIMICNGQNNKISNCNTEEDAVMTISRLIEVKKQQSHIDSISKFTKGLSYIVEDESFNNEDCFRIKVGYSTEFHWDTYFIFYIMKSNCKYIYVDEVISGDIITLREWRRRELLKK